MTPGGGEPIRGAVIACGRYGCVVRLADGRIANLPSTDPGYAQARRALSQQRKPRFPFVVSERDGWLHAQLAQEPSEAAAQVPQPPATETTLDDKIIDYLRQTEDWDPNGAIGSYSTAGILTVSPSFGRSLNMLGTQLGSGGINGGLSPLYQIGGPRSIQLALKLQF